MTLRKLLALSLAVSIARPDVVFAQNTERASKVTVAVADLSASAEDAPRRGQLLSTIAEAFFQNGRVELVPLPEIAAWKEKELRSKRSASPAEELKEARELLAEGKKAVASLDFNRALEDLAEARTRFIMKLPSLHSNRDLIDVHLYLGVTYLALKQEEKAAEEFRRVVSLDPKRELSARDFSPPVLEAFSKAKQETMSGEPSRVRIESTPAGGDVYLNGRSVGKTPLSLSLQPGEYFILVERKGMNPWYKPVAVEKKSETVRAELLPDDGEIKWMNRFRVREGEDKQSGLQPLLDMAGALGADFVFLGTLEKKKDYRLMGQLLDARSSEISKVAVATATPDFKSAVDAAPDLVETLLEFIRPDGKLVSAPPDLGIPADQLTVGGANRPQQQMSTAPAPQKQWYQQWWIYPLIIGVGAGAFFGARQLGRSSSGSKIIIDNNGNF